MIDRLELILKTKNLSASQLADETGIQRSIMSHVMNGRNKASLDFIQRILKRFPDINPDWLLFGKGTMSRENDLFNQEDAEEKELLKKQNAELQQEINNLQQTVQKLQTQAQNTDIRNTTKKKGNSIPTSQEAQETQETEKTLRDEEPPEYKRMASFSSRGIETIIVLYDDQSFKEYYRK